MKKHAEMNWRMGFRSHERNPKVTPLLERWKPTFLWTWTRNCTPILNLKIIKINNSKLKQSLSWSVRKALHTEKKWFEIWGARDGLERCQRCSKVSEPDRLPLLWTVWFEFRTMILVRCMLINFTFEAMSVKMGVSVPSLRRRFMVSRKEIASIKEILRK